MGEQQLKNPSVLVGSEQRLQWRAGVVFQPFLVGCRKAINLQANNVGKHAGEPVSGQAKRNGLQLPKIETVGFVPLAPGLHIPGLGAKKRSQLMDVMNDPVAGKDTAKYVE